MRLYSADGNLTPGWVGIEETPYGKAMAKLGNEEGTKAILQQLESEGYEMEDCEEWEAPV